MPDVLLAGAVPMSDRQGHASTLDDRLRNAVGRVMDATTAPKPQDVAEIQRILTIRATEIRAPFEAKIRRAKTGS